MRQLWQVPFAPRMINDSDPGHEGPSCATCAAYQADRVMRAEASPMLRAPYGKALYKSPHAGTYLFEAAFSRWQCTQGVHERLRTY